METLGNEKSVREHADRAFFIIAQNGYQHPMNIEKFCNGITIVHGERYTPLYEGELKSLLNEFDNAIYEREGLDLYDD